MMKKLSILIALFIVHVLPVEAQVHRWEAIFGAGSEWKYFPGESDPGSDWMNPEFDDAAWSSGIGGVGYGDADDGTTINPAISVFLRKEFTISSVAELEEVVLHIDYDDGFIAYINGAEVFRRNMPADLQVPFNQPSTGLHEAVLPSNGVPEAFNLTDAQKNLLVDGANTFAIQVHNESLSSSDMSSSVFLIAALNVPQQRYEALPHWFTEPLNFESSDLPIIVINTNGQAILDETRIVADMGIVDNGQEERNRFDDPFNNYNGKISIEIRGESSQMFPKKSFSIETQNADGTDFNTSLLGFPTENDWVLYAPYSDKTMIRNVLTYKMGRDLGWYAPRTRYVELVLNGEYQGVYVLTEKIKVENSRVDIAELKAGDVTGDQLTGGYILRVDKIDFNDYPAWLSGASPVLPNEDPISFQFSDPDGENLQNAQRTYIRTFIKDFESRLSREGFGDPDAGYSRYIDTYSFIDFMIISEIGKNVDAYRFSTYMHKDKDSNGGLLKMGPLWDFNLAFGNVDYWLNSQTAPGWIYNDEGRMYWFRRLMTDRRFQLKFNCRWKELRTTLLTNAYFTETIDSLASLLAESRERNYQRWPTLGTYIWPNQFVGQTYEQEIQFLKTWIQNRLDWMDANTATGDCLVLSAEVEVNDALSIVPNPSRDYVTISMKEPVSPGTRVSIIGSRGEVVHNGFFDGKLLLKKSLAPGVYVVRVVDKKGRQRVARMLVH